jgi:hypothetical protein
MVKATPVKIINNIIPSIKPALSNKGIVHNLYGIKNLKNIIGIAGRLFIKGIIPKIFEEGFVLIILSLNDMNKIKEIVHTVKMGIISFIRNVFF